MDLLGNAFRASERFKDPSWLVGNDSLSSEAMMSIRPERRTRVTKMVEMIGIGAALRTGKLLRCSRLREELAARKTAFGRNINHRVETPATRTTMN